MHASQRHHDYPHCCRQSTVQHGAPGYARGAAGVTSKAGEAYAEQEERTVTARTRSRGGRSDHDEDRDYIARKLGMKLGKFVSSIERITVRLSDTNGPKGGHDQRCQIKVVLSGLPSIVVNETDSTLPRTIDRAIDAVTIAIRRRVQRRRLKPLHHRSSHTTA